MIEISVHTGEDAHAQWADARFQAEWAALADACPWSTVFQGPAFVTTWYDVYRDRKRPLILEGRGVDGSLVGLLTLAEDVESGVVTCAGAPIAEYQTWLATEECGGPFIQKALPVLRSVTKAPMVRFLSLSPGSPTGWCRSPEAGVRTDVRAHDRPLMSLDDLAALQASLKKKSNRNRLSRLRRLGEVRLLHLASAERLEPYLEEILADYDVRQGAAYGVSPFTEDPLMGPFYRRLAAQTDCLHVTALVAGDKVAAANLGFTNGKQVVLGVIAHSAELASSSPAMLLIRLSAELLSDQGYEELDLTIGGSYKWRFASHSDQVQVLDAYLSRWAHWKHLIRRTAVAVNRRVITKLGWGEEELRSRLRLVARRMKHLRRQPLSRWPSVAREWSSSTNPLAVYYRETPPEMRDKSEASVLVGALKPLSYYDEVGSATDRTEFLQNALRRLEKGATPYSIIEGGRLLYVAWSGGESCLETIPGAENLQIPEGASLVFGDYAHPDAQADEGLRSTLRRRFVELASSAPGRPVLAFVDPAWQGYTDLLESMGFREWDRIGVRTERPRTAGQGSAEDPRDPSRATPVEPT